MAVRTAAVPRFSFGAKKVAIAGIVLGCVAFLLTLPPLTARAAWWPALAGVPAIAAGIWAASRGERRIGLLAVGAGIFGIGLGVLATRTSSSNLDYVASWAALCTAMFAFATPLTFAAIGGMFSERSGVVNIGLEGMMLTGAFFGVVGSIELGHWAWGILLAVISGGGMAVIHAFVSIHLRADQIVSGTAVNFLALGITGYFFIELYGEEGTPGTISQVPDLNLP